ncbi:hypothetical protein [Sphaerisporangium corydalis]|uniref:Uncharacterized protein n=1 Tax=Sphaerisporangium corydalis TaxID=1441875 RepID=A0ABV9EAT7_9ACTN|nr:hypothetical protein [Sphaerisporangium corydalis]
MTSERAPREDPGRPVTAREEPVPSRPERPGETNEWPGQRIVARRDAFTAARDLHVNVRMERPAAPPEGTDVYRRERSLFIQYVNPEILACHGMDATRDDAGQIMTQALSATRLAVLLTDAYLIFPSSYIFELPWFDEFLARIAPLVHDGLVRHTSATPELTAYQEKKALEYRQDERNPYSGAHRVHAFPDLVWYPHFGKPVSIGIAEMWARALTPEGDLSGVVHSVVRAFHRPYGRVERAMAKSPERLQGQAFVRRFVERTLPGPLPGDAGSLLGLFLSAAYLRCYVRDLDTSLLTDLPIGPLSCELGTAGRDMRGRILSSRRLDLALQWLRVDHFVHRGASWKELVLLRSSPEFGMITSMLFGNGSANAFRLAIISAGRSRHFGPAATCGDALSNVAIVADHLARMPG